MKTNDSVLHIGLAGLGNRGQELLKLALLGRDNVKIACVCDVYEDRVQAAVDLIEQMDGYRPLGVTSYEQMLAQKPDAVVIATPWETHIPFAIAAMKANIPVGCEVGGATSLDECWQLVHTYEETHTPCMLLENCCFGQDELMVLHMVRQGLFGEVVHCEGGYRHDLREEICFGEENRHYRLRHYKNRSGENYPTHELGPIAKVLRINRGNRMVSLTSTTSCARGLNAYAKEKRGEHDLLATYPFAQGDVVTTVIRCAHGETITLTLDTTLPRPYSRGFHVQGTKGMYEEANRSVFLPESGIPYAFHNAKEYRERFDHPMWKRFVKDGVRGGHGGMDGLVFDAFFAALQQGKPMPIDVYDMAAWMSITPLSEQSIACGSMPVAIPDFTSGAWCSRGEEEEWAYSLTQGRE